MLLRCSQRMLLGIKPNLMSNRVMICFDKVEARLKVYNWI